MSAVYAFASIIVASLFAGLGAGLLFLKEEHLNRILVYLVALSAGAIFGGVFIHLIPRYVKQSGFTSLTGLVVVLGIAGSYMLEKALHWHCHHSDHEIEPFSYMLMVGDGIHNLLDGMVIAASYLVSVSAGVAATIAVILHKVPKEVGDFGVLVHGGMSKEKALGFNIGISLVGLIGAAIIFLISSQLNSATRFLIPLAVGNFVYIAGSDLLPEIKERNESNTTLQVLVFLLGISMMYSIVLIKPFI